MKLSTQILLGFLIAISIDLVDSFVNYTLTLKVKTDSDFLSRSETVIRNSSAVSKGVVDMQNAFRGYLLTDDERFLDPYYEGLSMVPALIRQEAPIITLPTQRSILDSIMALHNSWIRYADHIITAKKMAGKSSELARQYRNLIDSQLKKGVGKSYNDKIAGLFRTFAAIEYKVREERRASLSESIYKTDKYSLIFSILLVLSGLSIAAFLVKKISRRIDSLVKLAENISRGDFSAVMDDKHDELSSLSISLNLMSDKLSRNINELEKRNAELNQFAYVVSHDLKAPVRGISNVVHWIEEDLANEISPEMRKFLNIINERIRRMGSLIDGLLEYARIGRNETLKEEVDVGLLIRELSELIVPKGYEVNAIGLPTLYTEKLLLQQVFGNLISNAVKYTPKEGLQIVVSCVETDSFYEFSVMDNGPGIEPEYHEKIFVIFQTLREKDDKESTGIGLAIVKKIIEEKNCTIKVLSSPGAGSNFVFTWPKR